MKLTVSQGGKRVWVCEWVVTYCQKLPNVTVLSVVVISFLRQKTNKPKLVKQCGRHASKMKTSSFEIFLKWRNASPILHYAVNFIRRGRSRKFKAWSYSKKASEFIFFYYYYLNTFLNGIEIPKACTLLLLASCPLTGQYYTFLLFVSI